MIVSDHSQAQGSMLSAINVGSAAVGSSTNFTVDVENIGPDPITILGISNIGFQYEGPDPEFTIIRAAPVIVPAMNGIEILGSLAPVSSGVHQTTLELNTDDPGFGPSYEVTLTGTGLLV
jgi:hypothetical protein